MKEQTLTPSEIESICSRAGLGRGDGAALIAPIVQSTSFCRENIGSDCAHQYSRVSNPTVAALEEALGQLEDAPPAVCFSTGLAAETALFLSVLRQGDHVVCSRYAYGGTTRLLQQLFPAFGVETSFVDPTDLAAVERAIQPATRLLFFETPANPTLEVTDLRAVCELGRAANVLVAVDNTFLTAALQQPLAFGADISVYSTTKYIDGHSAALGGALVSRDAQLLERIRFIRKSTGGIQTPFNAWLTLQGLKTLPLRLARQSESAATIARWLSRQSAVDAVYYPGLGSAQQRALAAAQHRGADGAVVSFDIVGGLDAGRTFVEALQFCRLAEHVGSVETLVTHPASMTHGDVPADQRAEIRITDGLLRLSVGLEPAEVIIADLERAFAALSAIGTGSGKEVVECPAVG